MAPYNEPMPFRNLRIAFFFGASLALGGAMLAWGSASHGLIKGKILSVTEAKKKWGAEAFDATRFRDAKALVERARMAASAVETKAFVGRPYFEVKEALGPVDGYYGSDYFPAYILE